MSEPKKLVPLLRLQPTLKILPTFLEKYLTTTAILLILSILIRKSGFSNYIIAILLLYAVYAGVKILIEKIQTDKAEYLFFEDGVILVSNKKTGEQSIIAYDDMENIVTEQSDVERFFNLGNFAFIMKKDKMKEIDNSIKKMRIRTFRRNQISLKVVADFKQNAAKLNEIINPK